MYMCINDTLNMINVDAVDMSPLGAAIISSRGC